mgnify:CR=1 FL=1
MRSARRRLVLDSGAAGALRSERPGDRRRAAVLAAIAAADGGVAVPTSVRVEVGWDRRDPRWAGANRLVRDDDALDRAAGDVAAALQARLERGIADAHVVATALRSDADVVEVLTSDPDDVGALLARVGGGSSGAGPVVEVHRV